MKQASLKHQQPWELFYQRANAQRLPHAFLLTGQEDSALSEFARRAAAFLLCLQPGPETCGHCKSCHLLSVENHPDLCWLEPEEGHGIKIDEVRNMISTVGTTPHISHRKVVVITPAETMNVASCNALLKTLEEPPDNTIIFLVSHHFHLLPLTIRSRCQTLVFNSSDSKIMLEQIEWRNRFLQDIIAIMLKKIDPLTVAGQYYQHDLKTVFKLLHTFIMDVVRLHFVNKSEFLYHADFRADIQILSSLIPVKTIFLFETKLQSLKKSVLSGINLNKQLMLEDLLIDLHRGASL